MRGQRGVRARALAFALVPVTSLILLGGGFVPSASASESTSGESSREELDKLRGLPRFVGEYDRLERDGELSRLSSAAFDELLVRSGSGTVRELIAALDGSADPAFSELRSSALDAALDEYPAWVVRELRGITAGGARPTRRVLDALVVLELRGGAGELETARELVDPHDPEQRPDRGCLRAYEAAMTAMLSRDRRAIRVLEDDWDKWPENLWIATVKSVGGAGSSAALDLLTWLLQDAQGTHEFLVQQIGRVGESSSLPGDFALHSTLIDLASSQQPGLRREACMTLGKLQCSEAIDTLIAGLGDSSPGVRDAALWSLQTITGKNMKPEIERWRSWYAVEVRWWRDEFPALQEKLHSDDVAVVGVAIRELGRRKLRRHELATELVPLLDDPREGVVCMTIAGLGALGSAVAVEPLVEQLDAEPREVRDLALRALQSITGRDDLPAEKQAWSGSWQRR
ncbi:MAG: HEAT repeat domain-containing protein [Planctomycetes bacterium]|nr:HEAT repeat domain-containing protein [Planctomycetota bacterium]